MVDYMYGYMAFYELFLSFCMCKKNTLELRGRELVEKVWIVFISVHGNCISNHFIAVIEPTAFFFLVGWFWFCFGSTYRFRNVTDDITMMSSDPFAYICTMGLRVTFQVLDLSSAASQPKAGQDPGTHHSPICLC